MGAGRRRGRVGDQEDGGRCCTRDEADDQVSADLAGYGQLGIRIDVEPKLLRDIA